MNCLNNCFIKTKILTQKHVLALLRLCFLKVVFSGGGREDREYQIHLPSPSLSLLHISRRTNLKLI